MFANDSQRARVCQALVAPLHKGELWTAQGLTDTGRRYWRRMPGFSHGEVLVLRFAFWLWNDSNPSPKLGEMMDVLDGNHATRIASFWLAFVQPFGAGAIDAWLAKYEVTA